MCTDACTHWLDKLVNELTESSDTHPSQEFHFKKEPQALPSLDQSTETCKLAASFDTQLQYELNFEILPEALNELEFSHPEILKELQFVEESKTDEETALHDKSLSEGFGEAQDSRTTHYTGYALMSRNAGSGENGDFGEILLVNLTIFMQITLTEMGLTCWRIWRFWRFLCKLRVGEFEDHQRWA